jgi:hypothetical protein
MRPEIVDRIDYRRRTQSDTARADRILDLFSYSIQTADPVEVLSAFKEQLLFVT